MKNYKNNSLVFLKKKAASSFSSKKLRSRLLPLKLKKMCCKNKCHRYTLTTKLSLKLASNNSGRKSNRSLNSKTPLKKLPKKMRFIKHLLKPLKKTKTKTNLSFEDNP